jgi:hypothetical protein
MNRFDNFLFKNLPRYLENKYINEIIITDENGSDAKKIEENFPNNPKLTIIINETTLGPFKNKLKVCSFAKNDWIALIDSDNFADVDYFKIAQRYIENNLIDGSNVILSPCEASEWNFKHLSGIIFKKNTFNENKLYELNNRKSNNTAGINILHNLGNFIINKQLINRFNLNMVKDVDYSDSCDVIYFNYLLYKHFDLNFHVVPDMKYEHICHDGSIYLNTFKIKQYKNLENKIHSLFNTLV